MAIALKPNNAIVVHCPYRTRVRDNEKGAKSENGKGWSTPFEFGAKVFRWLGAGQNGPAQTFDLEHKLTEQC